MEGVILFVSYWLINFAEIRHVLTSNKSETAILAATFLTGIFTELDLAIVIGVITSLCVFYTTARTQSWPSVHQRM